MFCSMHICLYIGTKPINFNNRHLTARKKPFSWNLRYNETLYFCVQSSIITYIKGNVICNLFLYISYSICIVNKQNIIRTNLYITRQWYVHCTFCDYLESFPVATCMDSKIIINIIAFQQNDFAIKRWQWS